LIEGETLAQMLSSHQPWPWANGAERLI